MTVKILTSPLENDITQPLCVLGSCTVKIIYINLSVPSESQTDSMPENDSKCRTDAVQSKNQHKVLKIIHLQGIQVKILDSKQTFCS